MHNSPAPNLTALGAAVGRHTVLVVEDEPPVRELVADLLRDAGYEVMEARDGLEALRALDERCPLGGDPRVILLDMMLPHVDGVGVLRHLTERGYSIPVVAMSASCQHLTAAAAAGAQTTLPKPFDLDELVAVVARYCTRQD
jgi:CheY-like chemotaxis protein